MSHKYWAIVTTEQTPYLTISFFVFLSH